MTINDFAMYAFASHNATIAINGEKSIVIIGSTRRMGVRIGSVTTIKNRTSVEYGDIGNQDSSARMKIKIIQALSPKLSIFPTMISRLPNIGTVSPNKISSDSVRYSAARKSPSRFESKSRLPRWRLRNHSSFPSTARENPR